MNSKLLKIFVKVSPIIILVLVSLIPVYYTWGKIAIGGDTILPFNPEAVTKYLWQWYGSENGQYFTQNLAPLFLIYKIAALFSVNNTIMASILIFSLNFLAGLAIYKICKLIYRPLNVIYLAIPIIFYLLSPALLNSWRYCFIYSFAPWFIYFIIKFILRKEIKVIDIFLSSVVLFFASVDLPNPKYIFFLFLAGAILLVIALVTRIINLNLILKNWWKFCLFFAFSFYLLFPIVFFGLNFNSANYGIHIRQNYSDTGRFMDQGFSTVNKMIQLHQTGINLNSQNQFNYNNSRPVALAGSVFFILIISGFLLRKPDNAQTNNLRKLELTLLSAIILFLLLATGPNPPLGFVYIYLVSKFGSLAFLRTTAGAVFFMSIFYSILLFGFLEKFRGKIKICLSIVVLVALYFSSYPLINGSYYENLDVVGNRDIDKSSHGVNLPSEYFEINKQVDKIKIDGKLLNLKNDLAYANTKWGYFGPSPYNLLFNYYNIGFNKIISTPENHSVAYTLDDKSLIIDDNKPLIGFDRTITIANNSVLELDAVSSDDFLPHFWVPIKSRREDILLGDLPEISAQDGLGSAVFIPKQNELNAQTLSDIPKQTESKPEIEYKKINPTKYRVIVHKAKTIFPLVFNETFDKNWKMYLENYHSQNSATLQGSLGHHVAFDGNENFQATKEEVSDYIEQGIVTDLGSEDKKQENDLGFISKNMSGTIQNDNLSDGSLFETWFQKPLFTDKRLVANGYANSWLIDPSPVCKQGGACQQNSDGSYDLEFVVEFLPQRVFWTGLIISFGSVLISLSIAIVYKVLRRNNKKK